MVNGGSRFAFPPFDGSLDGRSVFIALGFETPKGYQKI